MNFYVGFCQSRLEAELFSSLEIFPDGRVPVESSIVNILTEAYDDGRRARHHSAIFAFRWLSEPAKDYDVPVAGFVQSRNCGKDCLVFLHVEWSKPNHPQSLVY
jgi:hypothetical protein